MNTAAKKPKKDALVQFILESNVIEGLDEEQQAWNEMSLYSWMLGLKALTFADVANFVNQVAPGAKVRSTFGMDVTIGESPPPKGGPEITERLGLLLWHISHKDPHPFLAHREYERLHPFMDGNGRSGRMIWLWQMRKRGYQYGRPFLLEYYYQSIAYDQGEQLYAKH